MSVETQPSEGQSKKRFRATKKTKLDSSAPPPTPPTNGLHPTAAKKTKPTAKAPAPRPSSNGVHLTASRKAEPEASPVLGRENHTSYTLPMPPEYLATLKNWNREREALEKAFFFTGITGKTSAELGRYLLVLANAKGPSNMARPPRDFDDNTKRYEQFIRQLLQVKIAEETQARTARWTRWTAFAAAAALLLSVFNTARQFGAPVPDFQAPAPTISMTLPLPEPTLPLASPIPEPTLSLAPTTPELTLSLGLPNPEPTLSLAAPKPEGSSTPP